MTVRLIGAAAPLSRDWFARDPVALAPDLLGAVLSHRTAEGTVSARLTEVEAYRGVGADPGSHAHRGLTPRTRVMFEEPAHLFVYFTYGMHTMLNIVCHPEGVAGGVLLRAAELVDGQELVAGRRGHVPPREWLRGPGRLAQALGVRLNDNGTDLYADDGFDLVLTGQSWPYRRTARTGVSGAGGALDYDWRFALLGEHGAEHPSVSPYKRHPKSH